MSYTVKNGVLPNTPGKMDFVNVVFCLFVCLFVVFCFCFYGREGDWEHG